MYNSVDSVHSSSPGLGLGSLHSGAPVGSYLVDATWNPDAIDTRANPNKGRRKLFKPTTTTTTARPPPITTTRRPLTTTSTHVKFTPIPGNVKSKVSGSNDFLAYQEQKRKFLGFLFPFHGFLNVSLVSNYQYKFCHKSYICKLSCSYLSEVSGNAV